MKKDYSLRILLISVFMLVAVSVCHAVQYTPNPDKVTNSVNVRSGKSTRYAVLGKIQKGETFEVIAIQGQWAEIDYLGRKGYVHINYIQAVPEPVVQKEEVKEKKGGFNLLDILCKGDYDVRWMVWLILGLIILLLSISLADLEIPLIKLILMFLVSLSEIIYIIYVDKFMWFFTEPRWWWCAINFIIFAICTIMQMACLLGLARRMSHDKAELGIYSVPAALVIGIIFSFISDGQYMPWVLIAFLIVQLIQAGIIFYEMRYNIGLALACSVTYLIGMIATILITAVLMYVVIMITIVMIVLMIFTNGDNGDLNLKNIGGDLYEDQHGDIWRTE